jgi:DNA polymerase III subunit chi
MPAIDFHILSDPAPDAHLRFACRLAEQAVDQGQRVFLRVESDDAARRVDDLLWTFGDRSFLPHEIATPASPSHPLMRILIGDGTPPQQFRDLLINLGSVAPAEIEALTRIAEIVPADPQLKSAARERFKSYRDRGVQPTSHNV